MANLDSDWAYGTRTLADPVPSPTPAPTPRRLPAITNAYGRAGSRALTANYGR